MENLIGNEIYKNRVEERLTQDQFGAKYGVSGPAIFKFEKGYVKPSFDLWIKMAKNFGLPEKRAVLMWLRSRLPDEYKDIIDVAGQKVAEEGMQYVPPPKGPDYAIHKDRKELRKAVLRDQNLPKGLKALVKDDEIWAVYKPSGAEINFLRDTFGTLGKGTKAHYREALRLLRDILGSE
jgi:DNA-binding XRE family transcriptional regulator